MGEIFGSQYRHRPSNEWWVDGLTTVPSSRQDGTRDRPYTTIMNAITALPNRSILIRRAVDRINIANTPGYDEDLFIDLTNRNLELIGNFSLGQFGGDRWSPTAASGSSSPRRHIFVTGDLNGVDKLEVSLVIASNTLVEDTIDFTATQYHGPRISGMIQFDMTNSNLVDIKTWLVMLQGRFYGTTGNTTGVSVENLNLTIPRQALNLQLARFRSEGDIILTNNGRMEDLNVCRINGNVRAGYAGRINQCRINSTSWDLQNATGGVGDPANGFFNCKFRTSGWTWAGPHNFWVDGESNYFAKVGPVSFISNSAGGPVASSIVQTDLVPAT